MRAIFGTSHPAQTAQAYLDLYEVTKKEAYKQAAIEAARVYTTSIFTYPIATGETKWVGDTARKDWEINQTGLGVEHIRGTAGGGPILITSYAGLFTRIYEWTKEPLFLTMARTAAVAAMPSSSRRADAPSTIGAALPM